MSSRSPDFPSSILSAMLLFFMDDFVGSNAAPLHCIKLYSFIHLTQKALGALLEELTVDVKTQVNR